MGACCMSNTCLDLPFSDCNAFGGIPWPNEDEYNSYDCDSYLNDDVNCPACEWDSDGDYGCFATVPTGACCIESNTCQTMTDTNCISNDGYYWGDGTNCDVDLCSTEIGACCCQTCGFDGPCNSCNGGSCFNEGYADCWARSTVNDYTTFNHGVSCCSTYGGNSICDDVNCTDCNECPGSSMGSCCYTDPSDYTGNSDNCSESNQGNCTGQQETWTSNDCGYCVNFETGSCCLNDICYRMTEEQCNNLGGMYPNDGLECDEYTCSTGACCNGDGTCTDNVSPSDCQYDVSRGFYPDELCDQQCNVGSCCSYDASGPNCTDAYIRDECQDWHGGLFFDGLLCANQGDNNNCFEQPGACCYDQNNTPTCGIMTATECFTKDHGNWQGEGSNCTVCNNSDTIISCCFGGEMPDGTAHNCFGCVRIPSSQCGVCEPGNCSYQYGEISSDPCPIGACCAGADSGCIDIEYDWETCIAFGGKFVGPETICDCADASDCETCYGSCCYTSGGSESCETLTFLDCDNKVVPHMFGGFGTNCTDNPCSLPGSCCQLLTGEGTCFDDIFEWDCQNDLQFFYEDSRCDDIECDNPTDGSCCLGGTCVPHMNWIYCIESGGVFDHSIDDCTGIACENGVCCKSVDGIKTCGPWVDNMCNCPDSIENCVAAGMVDCSTCEDDIAFACCSRVNGLFTGGCADGLFCDTNDLLLENQYCLDNPCTLGACCYYDEILEEYVCSMTIDYDCGMKNGTFYLDVGCDERNCNNDTGTIGSCCLESSPGCVEVSQSVCDNLGGNWTADEYCQSNNSCTDNNWGACCIDIEGSMVCYEDSSFDCEIAMGNFHYHQECSIEVCGFIDPGGDDCIFCGGGGCSWTGCPSGYLCCQPENICKENCGVGEPCYCSDDGMMCCPDGTCDFPCDENDFCGMGPGCPAPLECCDGNSSFPDDSYCAYPCDTTPQLILCCTAPNQGSGNEECETDNTSTTHECGVKTPTACSEGGGAVVSTCASCHDVCCPVVCCRPMIGEGCAYSGDGSGNSSYTVECMPVVVGYDHTGDVDVGGEGGCGGCKTGTCATEELECSSFTESCGETCVICSEGLRDFRWCDNGVCHCKCCCGGCDLGGDTTCHDWETPEGGPTCLESRPDFQCGEIGVNEYNMDTHTYVKLPSGECIWMECVVPNCPYPVCRDENQ